MTFSNQPYAWQWPDVGPTPVSYGLDAEIFDSEKFPNAQTFVREAIQNSLDARLDSGQPVRVKFSFHSDQSSGQIPFLADLQSKKTHSGLTWPEEWSEGKISWLTVQDYNSSGLLGDPHARTSDFWNYWLNFGLSNKNGSGRGGRGIGRVTFLIASRISTVIGLTRRSTDHEVLACGMSVLKPVEINQELKTSYAYLAKSPAKNIFDLYGGDDFHHALAHAFGISDQLKSDASGLALVIPFPHPDLTPERLIAATIENFAPAILNNLLVVEVDSSVIDPNTVDQEALKVANFFTSSAMKESPTRLLELARRGLEVPTATVRVDRATRLPKFVTPDIQEHLRTQVESESSVVLAIEVPVNRNSVQTFSRIVAVIKRSEAGRKPIDMFYREGMALPEVVARIPADIDLIVQANEGELATYLNFCEGKAHLDLLENRDVKDKLREKGFSDGVSVKRFVRWLMDDVRALVLPDMSKPDASVLSGFFSVTRKTPDSQKPGQAGIEKGSPNAPNLPPDETPPPPTPSPFTIAALKDGFRISANPHYTSFPASLRLEVAYANGDRKPKWSLYDFELEKMQVHGGQATTIVAGNVIADSTCGPDFSIEVTGFDTKRELVTNLSSKAGKDA